MDMDQHEMHDHSKMDHAHMHHDDMDMMEHGGHMMHMGNMKKKFWVSLILTIPIIVMSPFMGMHLPFEITFPGSNWIVAILGTIIFFYGGSPFFSGAKGELKEKKPAMMTLIAMGISVAYVYSIYSVIQQQFFGKHVMDFFWELSSLVDIMLLGHWIEMNVEMKASSSLDSLVKLLPKMAHQVINGQVKDVPLKDVHEDDILQVLAGEKMPADGIVIEGTSTANESMVTGESRAVEKHQGDSVVGGSVNGNGTLTIKVTGTGQNGYLAQVMKLINDAKKTKSKQENMADKVAGSLFYAAVTIALIAFVVWLHYKGLSYALSIAVATLVVACPHSLGLAIPLVVARSTSIAARQGLLIHNRTAMEQVKHLKYALMDKTGTLTEGDFKVHKIGTLTANLNDDQILNLMAALEISSSHPLAVGIVDEAKKSHLKINSAQDVSQITGVGLTGKIDGTTYSLVSANGLKKAGITVPVIDNLPVASTISYLIKDKEILGYVAQGDTIKKDSKEFIAGLKEQGIIPVMLTGDNQKAAQAVADELGIAEVKAELMPQDKEKIVREYQKKGKVMMIGDGINDAPSLTRADIGIAIGSGTDVAINSADVVLVKSNPTDVLKFLKLARKTTVKMTENLWWGAGYNIIVLPLAAGILAPIGFVLSPMVGAAVMSCSTIIVAFNAMFLK